MTEVPKNFIPKEIDRRIVPLWYAIYVRSRYEKKVAEQLKERQIEYFLPLVSRLRLWKDRKKMVQMPLFPGYVFVHIKLADKLTVLTVDGAVYLVKFEDQPAPIPDSQIENIRRLLAHPKLIEPYPYIDKGEWVEIIYGPFAGVRGKLIQNHGRRRLLVGVELIRQAISVEVDISWVKRLEISEPENSIQ